MRVFWAPVVVFGGIVIVIVSAAVVLNKNATPRTSTVERDMHIVSDGWLSVYHDDKRSVSCWVGVNCISCLPDKAFATDGGAP